VANGDFFVETSLSIVPSEAACCDLSNLLIARLSKALSIAHPIGQIRLFSLGWAD